MDDSFNYLTLSREVTQLSVENHYTCSTEESFPQRFFINSEVSAPEFLVNLEEMFLLYTFKYCTYQTLKI